MELDVHNGKLRVGEMTFDPDSRVENNSSVVMKEMNPGSRYKNFIARDPEAGIAAVACYFENALIQWGSISLTDDDPDSRPFEVSDGQRQLAYARVEELGGEQCYVWGKVTVSEDRKVVRFQYMYRISV